MYFEIDPDVEKIARQWFTYLDDCKGKVQVVTGDGRLLMQDVKKDTNEYDIIMVDAFTGDSIPTHLLTREAIKIYLSHLSQGGIIVFHVSNRFYDLRPVLASAATELKVAGAMRFSDPRGLKSYESPSSWVVFARSSERLEPLLKRGWKKFENGDGLKVTKAWTDDHINIISSFKGGIGDGLQDE